jgi:uncharacterized protein DUF3631
LKNLDGTELRRECARFVKDHAEEITVAGPEIPADLNDRAADIWEPLLALAELAGGDWPERARAAAVGLTAGAQEESAIGARGVTAGEPFLYLVQIPLAYFASRA